MYIYIYIAPHVATHLCGNSWAWAHDVRECLGCDKPIVVITGRTHCFHHCICITPILLL